jgi:hypothetical protein
MIDLPLLIKDLWASSPAADNHFHKRSDFL